MNDTISRQAAIDAAMQDVSSIRTHEFNAGATRAANRIKQLPSVEPEIIHCRDCIHWKSKEYVGNNDIHTLYLACLPCKNWLTAGDWYCGSAERREEYD